MSPTKSNNQVSAVLDEAVVPITLPTEPIPQEAVGLEPGTEEEVRGVEEAEKKGKGAKNGAKKRKAKTPKRRKFLFEWVVFARRQQLISLNNSIFIEGIYYSHTEWRLSRD